MKNILKGEVYFGLVYEDYDVQSLPPLLYLWLPHKSFSLGGKLIIFLHDVFNEFKKASLL